MIKTIKRFDRKNKKDYNIFTNFNTIINILEDKHILNLQKISVELLLIKVYKLKNMSGVKFNKILITFTN